MTGVDWLDWLTAGAFGLLAVVSLGRLARRRSAGERADAGAHGVMAAGMAGMAMPGGNPVPAGVWVAGFVVVGAWAGVTLVTLVRSPGRRRTPAIRGPGPPPADARQLPLAAATHHVAASALMIVLLLAPEVGVMTPTSGAGSHAGHHHHASSAGAGGQASAALAAPTPLVALAGVGFLAYAGWLAVGLAWPRSRFGPASCACAGGLTRGDAAHGVAMAAGMGLMALAMA